MTEGALPISEIRKSFEDAHACNFHDGGCGQRHNTIRAAIDRLAEMEERVVVLTSERDAFESAYDAAIDDYEQLEEREKRLVAELEGQRRVNKAQSNEQFMVGVKESWMEFMRERDVALSEALERLLSALAAHDERPTPDTWRWVKAEMEVARAALAPADSQAYDVATENR